MSVAVIVNSTIGGGLTGFLFGLLSLYDAAAAACVPRGGCDWGCPFVRLSLVFTVCSRGGGGALAAAPCCWSGFPIGWPLSAGLVVVVVVVLGGGGRSGGFFPGGPPLLSADAPLLSADAPLRCTFSSSCLTFCSWNPTSISTSTGGVGAARFFLPRDSFLPRMSFNSALRSPNITLPLSPATTRGPFPALLLLLLLFWMSWWFWLESLEWTPGLRALLPPAVVLADCLPTITHVQTKITICEV